MKLNVVVKEMSDDFKRMVERASLMTGFLNRVAYPELIRAQRMRWQTENVSQGKKWEPLNPTYAKSKLRKFRDYPGGGRKMVIATARLVRSMTGEDKQDHWKLVQGNKLEMGTLVPYAKYVEEQGRDITSLSDETVEDLADKAVKYILTGRLK